LQARFGQHVTSYQASSLLAGHLTVLSGSLHLFRGHGLLKLTFSSNDRPQQLGVLCSANNRVPSGVAGA
jgi:hypothetical protein